MSTGEDWVTMISRYLHKPRAKEIIYNHTVEFGLLCEVCERYVSKKEITKGVCKYCRAICPECGNKDLEWIDGMPSCMICNISWDQNEF